MYKTTDELVPGDIVGTHGMRVKLHSGVRLCCYKVKEDMFRWGGSGEVLNPEEVIGVGPTWWIEGSELDTWWVEDSI